MTKEEVDEILRKYSRRLGGEIQNFDSPNLQPPNSSISREYLQFKKDMMPEFSRYENWAKGFGNFLKIRVSSRDEEKINRNLQEAHLEVNSGEVVGLAVVSFISVFVLGILASVVSLLFDLGFPLLFLILMFVSSLFLFYYFYSMPARLANKWRLKASSQMVPAILYAVIYMKHTSNLERAISFVSKNIEAPLSLDLRKVLWDVETGKYSSVKDSLDSYLDFWRETNIEFVESFHLIESSLYEPDEARRIQILEKALQVILDGVYERMLKYTYSIKSPLTNLYMLGIVLPTLGLALLPLASTLLGGIVKWSHIFILFNLIIPFFVFYLTLQIMLKRPGGHGETSLLENNPFYYEYTSRTPYVKSFLLCLPFFILGLLPLIFGYTSIPELLGINSLNFSDFGLDFLGKGNLFGFQEIEGKLIGPSGVVSLILSLFIPFSISLFFALSFSLKTKRLINARNQTKELEEEFNSSLFTLGNRLGDGIPAEIAFAKVADSSRGQKTENFFRIVHTNIQSMGMGLDEAIFNSRRGALVYYPSGLIATSMRILIESVKKGLKVASQSLMSISEYIGNMHKINQRLNDLLADVVSDMKSNMCFLAPLLAGIVVGLSGMITEILVKLKELMDIEGGADTIIGFTTVGGINNIFDVTNMIPPYFMQIAIGIYIIQIIFILTGTLVTIDSGEDKLKQTYDISKNLIKGGLLYLITALIAIISLSALANVALGGLGG